MTFLETNAGLINGNFIILITPMGEDSFQVRYHGGSGPQTTTCTQAALNGFFSSASKSK